MPPDATRSRSGCATCRRRRKKCDEVFDSPEHIDSCQRCYAGSFTCDRSALPRAPAKPRRSLVAEASPLGAAHASAPRATTSAQHPHLFASTSAIPYTPFLPYSFPELEASPFMSNFFESLDNLPPTQSIDEQLDYQAASTLAGVLAKAPSQTASPASTSSAVDDLAASAPLYTAFNDSFLRSIPNPLRQILTKRVDDVSASHELTRTSCLAVVLLYRARSQPNGAETRAKLIEQSTEYFDQSLQHLQAPIPLEAQMIAVLDLQYVQFELHGSAAAFSVILLGDFFCSSALGPAPKIDFATLVDPSEIPLRCFAYTEILQAVYIKGRKTIFDIANLPDALDSPVQDEGRQGGDTRFETHLGLPVGLLLCLAATSTLSVEMGGLEAPEVERRRGSIEAAIRQWRPSRMPGGEGSDSVSYMEEVRIGEIWRQAALIHLFQSVHRLGPHSPLLRHSLSQILSLVQRQSSSFSEPDHHSFTGSLLAAPLVLASMIATSCDDREQCRQVLVSCGQQMGYAHNLLAVEKVWAVTDERGWTVDWRDVLEQEGMIVSFL